MREVKREFSRWVESRVFQLGEEGRTRPEKQATKTIANTNLKADIRKFFLH